MRKISLLKYDLLLFVLIFGLSFNSIAQQTHNKPAREKWFENLAFGMMITWGVDVQLGGVVSHSLAGASEEYVNRYYEELPEYFDPDHFNPTKWAKLARLAGMKYVVFEAKHTSGFCMFDTKTTPYNVMNTPYGQDVTKKVIDAFRAEGITIGLYFSPEDFLYLHKHNIPIGRLQNELQYPGNNPGLMKYDKQQLKELLTNYGKIDILFIDGPAEGLKEYAWAINPDLVITRGAMRTPEQTVPGSVIPRPWEACYTSGTEWSYKAGNDRFKSGTDVITKLIEIRSKGGNLLLNVGPDPEGRIRVEERNILREVGMWMMANRDAIYDVKPVKTFRYKNVYFAQSNDDSAIYAFILRKNYKDWAWGTRKTFIFPTIQGTDHSKVEVLGYRSKLVEYRKHFDSKVYTHNSPFGFMVSAVNGQRFYTNHQWPNPIVLKMNHVVEKKLTEKVEEPKSNIDGAK